ncbi:hypothetical protein BpHYR1_001287 [Brachionus plicatilis]|uniref:Uncharacterized protein n=1 Tax=Brachionus plicatilis TaxID=10195 RepID=A0A3M7SXI9_BRAPC|nr:hypothetical protein BpHYR1_001287 [Brachionus plicatilis]
MSSFETLWNRKINDLANVNKNQKFKNETKFEILLKVGHGLRRFDFRINFGQINTFEFTFYMFSPLTTLILI